MTLEEYIQFFKEHRRKIKAPLMDEIVADFEKAVAHSRGIGLKNVLKGYRKTETEKDLLRRAELLQPVTKDIFDRTTGDLIEVLNPDLVNIDADERVKTCLDNARFMNFLQSDVIANMLDDPNGFLVAMPTATSQNGSSAPELRFWIVNYRDVVNDFMTDGFLVFKRSITDPETLEDTVYHYFLSDQQAGRFYEGKKGEYIIDETYYVRFDSPRQTPFYIQLGGQVARNKKNKKYYQSFYHAAFGHATMALRIHSDREVTRMRANLMILAQRMPCETCEETGTVIDPEDEITHIECPSCHGSGYKRHKWNIGDALEINAADFEGVDINNVVKFLDPPKEGVMMQDELAEKHLQRSEKALNMLFVDQAQSGVAKEIDKEHHTAMINTIAKNIYGRLVYWAYKVTSETLNAADEVGVTVPADFRQTSPEYIIEQINDIKSKGGTSGLLYPLFRRLYNTLYSNDAVSRKIALFQLEYDPLHIYNTVQEKRLAARDDREFEYSKQLPAALQRLAFSNTSAFREMTNETIKTRIDALIELPAVPTPILNENGE